jgi:hypothetical protein
MDIAVNLVENYLRLNGYLTLSEFEVARRISKGHYKTVTDVDIMAVRFPGDLFIGDPHIKSEAELLLVHDPMLQLEEDTIDVVIGEVKQGQAELNANIKDHSVLHTMLHRIEWLYGLPLNDVIAGLQRKAVHTGPSCAQAEIRTRLVAFGRSDTLDHKTISLSHIVRTMIEFMETHEAALKPIQFKEPAPAMLRLLMKAGFTVEK